MLMSEEVDTLSTLFASVGLDSTKSTETARNKKLASTFAAVIEEAGCTAGCPRSLGILLYTLASTCDTKATKHRGFIARMIKDGKLKSEAQIQAAIKYCGNVEDIDENKFEEECGVGVEVSEEVAKRTVDQVVEQNKDALIKERYGFNQGMLLKEIRARPEIKWADKKLIKDTLDAAILAILGPVSDQDGKRKREEKKSVKDDSSTRVFSGDVLRLHRPGENPQLNAELMKKHLEATGGKVITRFPPEPNGYPHIGHAKAMNFSFRYAQAHNGICYLRYDDTNPEAEEQRYYDALLEAVRWLGFEPDYITAASDYFPQLYECAVQLIKKDKAYVCHMTSEEIKESRGGEHNLGPRYPSPWRDRPVEESLQEFERMKNGEYEEGKAVLRLKQDMDSPNRFMWDLVAYRVLYHPHCRTGTAWCIYPMYDFTHCICDSIENITHSLCTTEFMTAREVYYWVLDNLEVYKPVQWEYGRLSLTHAVTSKRKVLSLVKEGFVNGWDDPRLYTVAALKRRGFTPTAINKFVEDVGITTASTITDVRKLESFVRDDLNRICHRRMAVLDPVPVKLVNITDSTTLTIPNDPRDPSKGESTMDLTPTIYIDASDFKTQGANSPDWDPEYYRLAPGQPVGLFKAGLATLVDFDCDTSGRVTEIRCTLDVSETAQKPKAFIQWVPSNAIYAEIRLYSHLFRSPNPADNPEGWLADISPASLNSVNGLVDPRLKDCVAEEKFQFQRVGYFCVDKDSTKDKLVFNLTVSIKEDPKKKD